MRTEGTAPIARLHGRRARRAAFVAVVDNVVGEAETPDVLEQRGLDAMHAADELRAIARDNTPVVTKTQRRMRRAGQVVGVLVGIVVVAAAAWIGGNVAGSLTETHARATVGSGAHVASADCWKSGVVDDVWRASKPFASVVENRCGAGVVGMIASGPITTGATATIVVGTIYLIVSTRRRRRRTFWY